MSTYEFIIALFWRVDDVMDDGPNQPAAHVYPSERVTIGRLFARKGGGPRAFARWRTRAYPDRFPTVPARTRLFRLLATHQDGTAYVLAGATTVGVADSYGIELLHPMREGRSAQQIGRKGKSNHRWIVGGKLAYIVNQLGLVVAWDCAAANAHATRFQALSADFQEELVGLTDTGFHAKTGDPPNMKVCPRGTWNVRMVVETVLAMLTTVVHFKKVSHRSWPHFMARLAFTMAMFNVLVLWEGLQVDADGVIHLSIAPFSL